MDIIQSKDNNIIKEVKKLKEKKHRIEKKQFLIEGFRFVEEALKSKFEVPMIFLSEGALKQWKDFNIEEKLQAKTKTFMVNDTIFKQLSATETPQGIAAVVNNRSLKMVDKEGFYILVDKLQDPGNLGTIIRSAHAAGALGILLTKGTVDVYNEKTLRSTMGSIFNVPIFEDSNLSKIKELKSKGFKLVVSSLDEAQNFYEVNLTEKVVIAVGNEGAGVSKEVYELEDVKVKIPMPGEAESLNAAVAASIMMFEIVRQKLTMQYP
ncbi:RNA methyltransferase [Clostridium sp. SYSU_GA19001]|uniref:TrmH family RNA methyltransferase n=1 Tax=Clostridium caldaquaticum TaxID=2940653 RepID=UPI00207783B9|nr:RNA methyltransferase [Clostridium caldaquaticum]MCM8711972.1 RNA methyltransferase [Clostridium caldaquaticum]